MCILPYPQAVFGGHIPTKQLSHRVRKVCLSEPERDWEEMVLLLLMALTEE